ncbi:CsxC family protein [Alkaliphilus transvaalensis]|uniref:CsxC family protein n=1 Tax=Alkaliphilus transvaalensis TaxID=114628 RepID=UPI0004790B9C|nr:hypothetical protein [Alkaliphilus transvaalensis]
MDSREVYIDKKNNGSYVTKYENAVVPPKSECKDFCVKVKTETIGECDNVPVTIDPITAGVVARIPVVLADLVVQFNVISKIDLPEPAIEIKHIKKRIKITQCMLLQDTNILFIKGFVRKNIDYSTKDCSSRKGICGDIRHCTVDVPFECTTPVTFNGTVPAPPIPTTSTEFEYLRTKDLPNTFAEKDKLLAGDLSEFNQISTEFFNELPFCKLISSRIVEFDEYLHREHPRHAELPVGEKLFSKIEEKMVITLRLQLLQDRPVAIGPTVAVRPCNE